MKNFETLFLAIGSFIVISCVNDRNFKPPQNDCEIGLISNTTYTAVKGLFVEETIQIQEDLVIEGYVTSSDEGGNFFSVLYFQNSFIDPTEGFQIDIDLRDSHLFYPVGSKIYIKLKGLYLGKSKEVFKIGGAFFSFGNISVGRLPASIVNEHVFLSCDEKISMQPTKLSIEDLTVNYGNTLVQFDSIQIGEEDLGQSFAMQGEETERILRDCDRNEIGLLNSGFSDFYEDILPDGMGKITGILVRKKDVYHLIVRTTDDIELSNERCENMVVERTSDKLFISELADPDNNSGARFVELYNATDEPLPLNGWRLLRYTNASIEISSEIDLSGFIIPSESTFVISPNAKEFENVYGFAPDLVVSKGSPADSNGDDNLVLVDPFEKVIDVFGIVGEDGSGTNHEFEDGRAVRNVKIKQANRLYTIGEWRVFNDSGISGTINEPQNAPQDFTPGARN